MLPATTCCCPVPVSLTPVGVVPCRSFLGPKAKQLDCIMELLYGRQTLADADLCAELRANHLARIKRGRKPTLWAFLCQAVATNRHFTRYNELLDLRARGYVPACSCVVPSSPNATQPLTTGVVAIRELVQVSGACHHWYRRQASAS